MIRKKVKNLGILLLLTLVWGAFLFFFQQGFIFKRSILSSSMQTAEMVQAQSEVASEQDLRILENQYAVEPVVIMSEPVREKCGDFYCYSSQEFVDLYNDFESQKQESQLSSFIYDNPNIDRYLMNIAETLGYKKRIFAEQDSLVTFENVTTRVEVRDSYKKMRDEMKSHNILLHFVSGYRSSTSQRSIFKRKAAIDGIENIPTGLYDPQIYKTLARSALPGYSKHHSGYAVDFGCGNKYLVYSFADTECYVWMSANNFENTKRFGFIPSYPEGLENQGPNPEPWEFVWVGIESLV